ncbi:hypothetical protein BDD12DRAFT_884670 [Trichophaea hybrida]|nr:hypothetical protein BDD12DRAFT_884670 [Trichophaea hybrida]
MSEAMNGFAVPDENGTTVLPDTLHEPVQALTPAQLVQLAAEAGQSSDGLQAIGKQYVPRIDVASDAAFPTLGGAPSRAAATPVKWVAGSGPINAPATVNSETIAPKWTPTIGNTSQQTIYTLQKEDKRPALELKKPASDLVRDVARKTNTKIEAANNKERGSTTYIIYGGSPTDRMRAKRELMRELTTKVTRKVSIPAVIRPFIIGKGGSKVQELQAKTLTNIKVPQSENVDTEAGEYEDDAVIDVIIEGDIEGCALAADLIGKIVKERVIKVTRHIITQGKFYPFIQGPNKSHIQDEPEDPIQVIGEKSAVEEVVGQIKAKISTLEASNYPIRGIDIINEVLAETGCATVIPPDGINKVYIVGPSARIPEAINSISQKLEENKIFTLDLCKAFANAPNGAKAHAIDVVRHARTTPAVKNIEKECDIEITYPSPKILYNPNKTCPISIIGRSKEYVDAATQRVKEIFGGYTPNRVAHIQVEPLHFKHIAGKDGKGPKKIAASTSVELLFPEDPEDDQIALIYEGQSTDSTEISEALEKAKGEISELVKGQAEIFKKVLEVPQEEHEKIRGERGTIINALNPSSVFVQFGAPKARPGRPAPKASENIENTITLRGPPSNVAATVANIKQFLIDTPGKDTPDIVSELFDYPKLFSGNLIGAKGANINKLRDDLGVDIKLSEGSGEIRGVKVCVDAARRKLITQIKELEDKAVIPIKIPQRFHSIIIGSEGSTVRRLEERYNVRINFPKAAKSDEDGPRQAPDEIVIRGSKKGAEEARQEITDLWKYEAENAHTATITILSRSVGYMFKNASKDIKQLRDESSARISIPQEDKNADPESTVEIRIRGKKQDVAHAQTVLSRIAKNAENTTARTINVDKKYHRSLIGPGGNTLRDIVVKAGGPDDRAALARLVRFPNQVSDSNEIFVQGSTAIVDKIIESIERIVTDKENQVTEVISVPPEKHRKLIGREGSIRRELEGKFSVMLEIPRQRPGQPQTSPDINIIGVPSAVEEAKAHILEMIKEPESETLEIPRRLHHAIADGGFFKQLQKEFKVTVDHNGLPRPPKPEDPKPKAMQNLPLITDEAGDEKVSWEIVKNSIVCEEGTYPWVLRGKLENITMAKVEIEKAIATAEKQSFTGFLILPDPRKYRFVIGPGGSTVDKIRKETGCRITVPRNQCGGGEAITLHGDEVGLEKAKDAILEIVRSNSEGRSGRIELNCDISLRS